MNAIVALCHFCELHGPRTLFCTQALHSPYPTSMQRPHSMSSSIALDSDTLCGVGNGLGARCEEGLVLQSEGDVDKGLQMRQTASKGIVPQASDMCEGCQSLPAGHCGFVSRDTESGIVYVSQQLPTRPELCEMLRQGCVRSLSCEVYEEHVGPVFFGDEQHGYVLTHTFYIRDGLARGLRRLYSLLMLMADRTFLVSCWPFLLARLRCLIEELQTRANAVFEAEQAEVGQRALRMNSAFAPGAARSLSSLTQHHDLWAAMHTSFTWLLKACASRLTERCLEGAPTEDAIVKMEKQLEREEEARLRAHSLADDGEHVAEGNKFESTTPGDSTKTLTSLSEGHEQMLPSCPLPGEGSWGPSEGGFQSLRHLRQVLGPAWFRVVAWHVLLGNQVIWRGENEALIRSAFVLLETLLPSGCVRTIPYSKMYQDAYRCNFLGIESRVALPPHITASELYVLVDIRTRRTAEACCLGAGMEKENVSWDNRDTKSRNERALLWRSCEFTVSWGCPGIPEHGPMVLNKLEAALENESLSTAVVERCLICLKEEWMNKVKVLFKFTKVEQRSREDTHRLLGLLGAQDDANVRLLKFWVTGLSKAYRSHLLTASRATANS
uniref:folliculin n=1 Tax=Myxine glutinosa TaxID=7769 RepID=UPI00358E5790